VRAIDAVMKWPFIYRVWMDTHAVLDVGCGPGTNTSQFLENDYLGIDWNERYIRVARSRYNREFAVCDVTMLQVSDREKFDFILVNSLLHHIGIESTKRLLTHLSTLLTQDGYIHIIELILPDNFSVPWILAKADRGEFPRSLREWSNIFTEFFDQVVFEPFDVGFSWMSVWNMIYFKGRVKRAR